MTDHHRQAAFYNTCVTRAKVPENPSRRRSVSRCEEIEAKRVIAENECMGLHHEDELRCGESDKTVDEALENDKSAFNMADFYESIPDYNDINHLSESEFYGQIERLKRKQAILKSSLSLGNALTDHIHLPMHEEVPEIKITFCDDNFATLPSRPRNLSKPLTKPRSKSAGSCQARKTVVSPFKMTQRYDEEQMLREMLAYKRSHNAHKHGQKSSSPHRPSTKGLNVPFTSKYLLYDQIMADQEKRSQIVRMNSKIELQSKIKPFHFYTNKISPRCATASEEPTESLLAFQDLSPRSFRAKPCPRSMFTNYFYHKMWEDDQFRALNRRIRAEELLKMSSLPMSMKKRQAKSNGNQTRGDIILEDPTFRSCSVASSTKRGIGGKKSKKRIKRKSSRSTTPANRNCFITTSVNPFEFETAKRSLSRGIDKISEAASSETTTMKQSEQSLRSTPQPIYPAARPNLAANLREAWSRKKLCELASEPKQKLPRDTSSRTAWGVRKTPAWKSLYFDFTNDEDISLRLSTRRAEERLRHEEHLINMELMRQRVRATPLLLEGQTSLPNTFTAGAHRCDPPQSIAHRTAGCSVGGRIQSAQASGRNRSRNGSALSNYSESRCDSVLTTKAVKIGANRNSGLMRRLI